MKSLVADCDKIVAFPPGHYYSSKLSGYQQYYMPRWYEGEVVDASLSETNAACKKIKDSLTESVRRRLMSEVPFGVFLSGGLDSSLIASIASKELKKSREPSSAEAQDEQFGIFFKLSTK